MIARKESKGSGDDDESETAIPALAFATTVGQLEQVQRSSQIYHASSVSSLDFDQLERAQRSSQIEDATRQCYDPFPSTSVQMGSVKDFLGKSFGRTVLSDKLLLESSSGRTLERTALSDKLFLKSSLGGTSGKTVLSNQLSSGLISEQALEHQQQHADITEDYNMMGITIISAQTIPARCGHSPVTDTDSASDSSDSVFFSQELPRRAPLRTLPQAF